MVFFTDVQSRINWRRRSLKAWNKMKTSSVTCMEDEFKDQSVTSLMTKTPRRRLSPTAPATLVGAPSRHVLEVIYNTSDPRHMKRCRQGQECEGSLTSLQFGQMVESARGWNACCKRRIGVDAATAQLSRA